MNLLPPAALLCALAFTAGAEPLQIRVATFNTLLTRDTQGLLATQLNTAGNNHAKRIAEIVQRVRPDIVLINEFDYDAPIPRCRWTASTRTTSAFRRTARPP